jgi:hypothetical protein
VTSMSMRALLLPRGKGWNSPRAGEVLI